MSILTLIALIALLIVAVLVFLKTKTNPVLYFFNKKPKKVITEETITTTKHSIDDIDLPRAIDEVHVTREEVIVQTETHRS